MFKLGVTVTKSRLRQGATLLWKKDFGTKRHSLSKKKVAVVLSGSGYLDGSCIYEATAVAVHLAKLNIESVFFAPACPQADVINHKTGISWWGKKNFPALKLFMPIFIIKQCPVDECRHCLEESARIGRGKIECLSDLRHCDVSAIIFPGGFGVAKTLSTFEVDRANCSIDSEVMRVMEEFQDVKKPMGFICIAAILPARMFPCVKVTLGMKGNPKKWPYQYAIECACAMGAEVEFREVDMFSFDKQHMVFSTPAFMYAGTFAEIFDGIGIMIQKLCKYLE